LRTAAGARNVGAAMTADRHLTSPGSRQAATIPVAARTRMRGSIARSTG
jgi:hypothetical protein